MMPLSFHEAVGSLCPTCPGRFRNKACRFLWVFWPFLHFWLEWLTFKISRNMQIFTDVCKLSELMCTYRQAVMASINWLEFVEVYKFVPMSSPISALPEYSDTLPPPFYSVQVSDGEELLASTGAPPSSRRTGSYTQRWDCGLEVILSEQTSSLASNDPPVYHQQGLICGKIVFRKNTESILQVFLKAKVVVYH